MQQNEQKDCKYSLHGYPLAFQYWIYEAFPQIGKKFGRRRYKTLQCPRMYKWKPKKILIEKVVKQFLATEHIQVVIPVLQPTEEEVETMWYINLSLPVDNQHSILDGIVNGQLKNVLPDTFANTSGTGVVAGDGVGSSSASVGSNPVTKEEMEEMLNMFRQHIVSDVSDLFDNLKSQIVEEQKAQLQAILDNQRQFFQKHQQWQEQHYQGIQSYVDKSLTLVKSYIDEQNKNVLNKLSDWKSNMETIISSKQVQSKHPLNISTLRRG